MAASEGKTLARLGEQIFARQRPGQRVTRGFARLSRRLQLLLAGERPQHVVETRENLAGIGRFADEVIRAGCSRPLFRARLIDARDHHHGQFADALFPSLAYAREQAEAIQLRHVEVGKHHDDRRIALDGRPRGLAIGRLPHVERAAQDGGESGAHELRVVDDQHALLRLLGRRRQGAYSERSTTIRRLTLALMKSSNTPGSSRNGIVRHISFRSGGFRSLARRCQTCSRMSRELSPELMPSRLTPRRMKGITVVWRSKLAARPTEAMTPFSFIVLAIQASISPPRLSTAPAQLALSRGRIFSRLTLWRSSTSAAPIFFSHSLSLDFPVSATTW